MKYAYAALLGVVLFSGAYAQSEERAAQFIQQPSGESSNTPILYPNNDLLKNAELKDVAISAQVYVPSLYTVSPGCYGFTCVRINEETAGAQVWIYDLMGNCVIKENLDLNAQEINLCIPPGRYFVIVQNGSHSENGQLIIE